MDNTKFQLDIADKDGIHHEEYDAFIGIEIKGSKVLLHIHENGNLPDSFWRYLPTAMSDSIEQGMKQRKASLLKP